MKTAIKEYLKKTFSYVAKLCSARKATFATICLGTLTAFVLTFFWTGVSGPGSLDKVETVLTQFLAFFFVFGLSAFCIESSPLKGRAPRAVILLLLLAGVMVSFFFSSVCYYSLSEHPGYLLLGSLWKKVGALAGETRIYALTAGLCIILYVFGIFFSFLRMENRSFAAYAVSNYSRLFFTGITFWILTTGTITLTGIFTVLIWGEFDIIYLAVFSIIFGGYLVMRTFECFTEETEEPNVFVSVLIRYVMLIMCLAAYVIIYIYMIKLVALQEFPSNSVFEILTALFSVSMPIACMSAELLKNKPNLLYKLAYWMPVIFAPFILLQVYTAGLRILQYGLTPKRYLGIMMIVFEIVYIILYLLLYKDHMRKFSVVLPVIGACAFIATWMPGVNAIDLSKQVQMSLIRYYLQNGNDRWEGASTRAAAAYQYICNGDTGIDPRDHFTEGEIESLTIMTKQVNKESGKASMAETHYWYSDVAAFDLDLTGYERMRYACIAASGQGDGGAADLVHGEMFTNEEGALEDYLSATDLIKNQKPVFETDLTSFAESHIRSGDKAGRNGKSGREFEDAMDKDHVLSLKDGGTFFITEVQATYEENTGIITEVLLKGYYLSR